MINNFVFALRKYKFAASAFFILTYFYVCFCNIQRFFLDIYAYFVSWLYPTWKVYEFAASVFFIFMYFCVSFATFEFAFLDIYVQFY